MHTISIVTITRNDAPGLRRTLMSIAEQDVQPLELIIVDGMSTDETQQVLKEMLRPSWSHIREPDDGVYDAMNKGWRAASGNYIQFLNSGDVLATEDALASVSAHLAQARSSPEWLVVGAVHGLNSEATTIRNLPHNWTRHALGLQSHCHQACFFRKDLLQTLGGMSLNYSFVADYDLILRAGMVAAPAEINRVLIRYEGGGMSQRRLAEIPWLLHGVRVDRLQLGRALARLDHLWAAYRRLYQVGVAGRDLLRSLRRLGDAPRAGSPQDS